MYELFFCFICYFYPVGMLNTTATPIQIYYMSHSSTNYYTGKYNINIVLLFRAWVTRTIFVFLFFFSPLIILYYEYYSSPRKSAPISRRHKYCLNDSSFFFFLFRFRIPPTSRIENFPSETSHRRTGSLRRLKKKTVCPSTIIKYYIGDTISDARTRF